MGGESIMSGEKILVVDDDEDILELVRHKLDRDGYRVIVVRSGEEALTRAKQERPDLVLLDLMLPGLDGMAVCRILRNHPATFHIPIVMVTGKGEDADIVTGLALGAEDYIVKPFSPRVLMARIRAVLRCKKLEATHEDSILQVHDLSINPYRHKVTVAGHLLVLTAGEFRLLHFLARHPGWVFTRDQIINAVRGEDYPVTERSVDVNVVSLRKKLGENGKLIETVRGVGYRMRE